MSSPPVVIIPTLNDVLFGKGTPINRHPGNLHLRSLVDAQKDKFSSIPKRKKNERIAVAEDIIAQVHNLSPGGRFLIEDVYSTTSTTRSVSSNSNTAAARGDNGIHPTVLKKVWMVAGHDKTIEKVLHRLREKDANATAASNKGDENNNSPSLVATEAVSSLPSSSIITSTTDDDAKVASACNRSNKPILESDDDDFDSFLDDFFIQVKQEEIENGDLNNSAALGPADVDSLEPHALSPPLNTIDDDFGGMYNKLDCSEMEQLLPLGSSLDVFKLDEDLTNSAASLGRVMNVTEQLTEYTMRQWVQNNSSPGPDYVRLSLPIALKLTEFILEAGDAIPLDSIHAKNVLIRTSQVAVDFAWIMSILGDSPAVGTTSARLCAMGNILYELFTGEEPLMMNAPTSIEHIDLTESNGNKYIRPQKRSQARTSQTGDTISTCMARLERKGVTWPVRFLVKNLLDCGTDDCCGNDAYTSFADLKQDLSLMFSNPTRFVDNIQVSTSLPTSLDICDKLYGRNDELAKLNALYQQCINENSFGGVIISGGAGVGKSCLALYTRQLSHLSNGYFCTSKFEQNQMIARPLATIGTVFNTLCNLYACSATGDQLKLVEKELETGLGSQAGLLAVVVPNLAKLLPSYVRAETASNCIDAAVSMRYLFGELLRAISSHSSRPITLFIDDIQFADPVSLLMIHHLVFNANKNASVFMVFSHRDDEGNRNEAFRLWQSAASMIGMEYIKLDNLSTDSVNSLVSETLHVIPRITRTLSDVLYQKTRGNPLFLRQLLGSLSWQGYIYVKLADPRWAWDLDRIDQHPICSSVLALLIQEMQQLHPNLQLGLGVASCLGSLVGKDVLTILSQGLGTDLVDILEQVSKKGFMKNVETEKGAMFCFAHDKIQEAAYGLNSTEQRHKDHMKYGLTLCSHALTNRNSSLFLKSITQINKGGPDIVHNNPMLMRYIAGLNLKAGRLSIKLSDYMNAFKFFQHGISYLGEDCWTAQYDLSLDLYDAVAEAAYSLGKNQAVNEYTRKLVDNAYSFEDSLHCLSIAAFALRSAGLFKEAVNAMLEIIDNLKERPLRDIEDSTLSTDMVVMNSTLQQLSEDCICNMPENQMKRSTTLNKLYAELAHLLHYTNPAQIGSVSLRLVELTLSKGITPTAPLGFAYYGEVVASIGKISEGCRLGKLALKLVEKEVCMKYKPYVIFVVQQFMLWYTEPLQAIAETHHEGYKLGQQLGDVTYATYNLVICNQTKYLTGQNLSTLQTNVKDHIQNEISRKQQGFLIGPVLLHYHVVALRQGQQVLEAGRVDDVPTIAEINISHAQSEFESKIYHMTRAFLFRQFSGNLIDIMNISDKIEEKKIQLRPMFAFGIFYEGLTCFICSFGATDQVSKAAWVGRGQSILAKIRSWHEHSSWNWENKVLLLEAMLMHTLGNHDSAGPSYISSIRSAREHKFIHEEAIASELAGDFFFKRGGHSEAYALYMHSIKCFNEWGALAVATRVEVNLQLNFGSNNYAQLGKTVNVDDMLRCVLGEPTDTNKRQAME